MNAMKMSRVLAVSVGTGIGSTREAVTSLAGCIAFSIESVNPDKVFFIVSSESEAKTLPRIFDLITPEDSEVFRISNPDNIQRIFHEIRPRIEELRSEYDYVAVDYTSGTKAMTGALAMLGVLYEANVLQNVTGERRNGIVQGGTEILQTVSPTFAISERKIHMALNFFNRYQYKASLSVIEEIENRTRDGKILQRVSRLRMASEAYSAWDRFDHKRAFEHLRQLKEPEFNKSKRFLGKLLNPKETEKGPYYVADLYNNAVRQGEEGAHDNAIARLYRVIELLAQVKLRRDHDINTSAVSARDLPKVLREEWMPQQDERMKIGLYHSYRLLKEKGDKLGELLESERMRDILSKRNISILAHGLTPVDEKTYLDMKGEIYRVMSMYISNTDSLIEDSTFPKLQHK